MIFVTGDTHSNVIERLNVYNFPQQHYMTKNDFVIICGDFGVIWNQTESPQEKYMLNWLDDKSFTTLFVDGNHENFNRLEQFEVQNWHGGKVHKIRPSVIHLLRGQVFDIDGHMFFTFGGAKSHDIVDGILEPGDSRIKEWEDNPYKLFRVNNVSWWKQELPTEAEMHEGLINLQEHNFEVDYIVTHDCSTSYLDEYFSRKGQVFNPSIINNYFELIEARVKYKHWYCGHHHNDCDLTDKNTILYESIRQICS